MSITSSNKLPNSLPEIVEFMGTISLLLENDKSIDFDKYLRYEEAMIKDLTIDQIRSYIELIKLKLSIQDSKSLIDDLTYIYTSDLVLERLLNLLNSVLHIKLRSYSKNDISESLFSDLQNEYFMIRNFESKLRDIFEFLLNKHIEASGKMDEHYINQLVKLKNNLTVKYIGLDRCTYNEGMNDISVYVYEDFSFNYLDKMIKQVIDILATISDEALENEQIYAYAMSYQILLRSLFIILDDYHRLATYEDYYMNQINTKSVAKGIITSAFIANYHDLNDYSLSKTKEWNYEWRKVKIYNGHY